MVHIFSIHLKFSTKYSLYNIKLNFGDNFKLVGNN